MARRGWVSAYVGHDTWRRLVVWDDGWVEVSAWARNLSDLRSQARSFVVLVALALLFLAAIPSLVGPVGLTGGAASAVTLTSFGLGLVVAAVLAVRRFAWAASDSYQRAGDRDQARRERERGQTHRSVPGAPRWRPAPSAAAYASWTEGVTHVDAATVRAVSATRDGDDHVVVVTLADGSTRTYRSPDGKLPELLGSFGPGRAGHQR